MTNHTIIKIDHTTKLFDKKIAVNDLSLDIKEGEIFAFLGQNGAGKTTTIKMMTGLLRPTSGSILIDHLDIQIEPEKVKSIIGYIPDSPYVYEKLTGREFLYFIGNLYKMEEKKIRERK